MSYAARRSVRPGRRPGRSSRSILHLELTPGRPAMSVCAWHTGKNTAHRRRGPFLAFERTVVFEGDFVERSSGKRCVWMMLVESADEHERRSGTCLQTTATDGLFHLGADRLTRLWTSYAKLHQFPGHKLDSRRAPEFEKVLPKRPRFLAQCTAL